MIAEAIWPDPAEEALARRAFFDLSQRMLDEARDFVAGEILPLGLCWKAALNAAAKMALLEAKIYNRPVPKIGAYWNSLIGVQDGRIVQLGNSVEAAAGLSGDGNREPETGDGEWSQAPGAASANGSGQDENRG